MQEENSEILRDFAIRLEQAATRVGLTQTEIAARLGLKPSASGRVNNWFKARNFPRSAERPALAKLLGVRPEWLFHGYGQPQSFSDDSVVNHAVEQHGQPVREVPVISWSHAGAATAYEEMPRHFNGKVPTTSSDPRAFAVIVEGDCMEPKVSAGDRVVCEPSRQPVNGKPVVAKHVNDEVQLRIYHKLPSGKIRLAPTNPVYPTIEYEPEGFLWIFPVKNLVRDF